MLVKLTDALLDALAPVHVAQLAVLLHTEMRFALAKELVLSPVGSFEPGRGLMTLLAVLVLAGLLLDLSLEEAGIIDR